MKRVVITSTGVVSPVGLDTKTFWDSVVNGRHNFKPITSFDTSALKVKCAAQIDEWDPVAMGLNKKEARRMDRFTQFAMAAAKQVMDGAGDLGKFDPFRAGVIVGSGIGGFQTTLAEHKKFLEKGPDRVSVFMIPMMICNMAAGNVAIQFGLKGKCINVVTACATGTHSIGEAFRAIQYGEADVMVAGGTEASITPIGIAGFTSLTALNTTDDPKRASIPFDKDRNGFVMGEGAGVVVLESLKHAKARGANILAEVVGYGATCDAYHITSPAEDGSGAAKAMEFAMKDAEIMPEQVDYINAHGTSTHHNDLFETKAIRLALGDQAEKVKINSTKSMIGHLLGAAGGVEFITCVKSIQDGYVHATLGLEEPGEGCDLDYTQGDGVEMNVNYAISNSLGFGGHNASLIVKKFTE